MNRKFRLLSALGIALVLSTFMIYTALAGSDVQEPIVKVEELRLASKVKLASDRDVELVGVAAGPVTGTPGKKMGFKMLASTAMGGTDAATKGAGRTVNVAYRGSVPDAFRVGRSVVVTGRMKGGTFVAQPDSLVTKCPSKFQASGGSSRSGG